MTEKDDIRKYNINEWILLVVTGIVMTLWAIVMGQSIADRRAMTEEQNVTESDSVRRTLYKIADKAAALVAGTDAKVIEYSHPESDNELLRIMEPGGDVLEERAYIGNVHFFICKNNTVFAFIRDDAGECLVLWKGDEWNLASVNICGEKMQIDWQKTADFNFHQELQDFDERSLTAYREI